MGLHCKLNPLIQFIWDWVMDEFSRLLEIIVIISVPRIDQTLPNKVENLLSTQPFCCRLWHTMNSKLRLRPSPWLQLECNILPTTVALNLLMTMFSVFCGSFSNEIIMLAIWSFDFKNRLKLRSVALLTARIQYCNPPKLLFLMWLMSMESLSPQAAYLLVFDGIFLVRLCQGTALTCKLICDWPVVELVCLTNDGSGCLS